MKNYEIFEKYEEELRKFGFKLTKLGEFDDKYVYMSKRNYEEVKTVWFIEVNKNDTSSYHMLEVEVLNISGDRIEQFLVFLNRLNGSFFNVTFYIRYDERENKYKIMLKRCYCTDDAEFNGLTYIFLIYSTDGLLREVIPKLIGLKYY